MYEPKPIAKQAVPAALEKALRYRLLNEPVEAESICRDVLAVDQPGRRWTWVRRKAGVQAAEADFHEAKAYFLELYNSATAWHRGSGERPDLVGEQSRVKADADAAMKKLENLGRKQ